MKCAIVLALATTADAFSGMTMMAAKPSAKAPVKNAVKKSIALPYSTTTLDTGFAGDFGFDPFGFASREPAFPPFDTLKWYREAELQHARVAMLAWLGFVFPAAVGHFPSTAELDYSELNPIEAFYKVPSLALIQITLFIGGLEGRRYQRCFKGDKAPGDQGWGVPGGWNPFRLNYTPEEYEEKQIQEIKNGRVAMLGAIGALLQNANSGMGVVEQLGQVFSKPEYVAKAGYFFTEGL